MRRLEMRRPVTEVAKEVNALEMQGIPLTFRKKQELLYNQDVLNGKISVEEAYKKMLNTKTVTSFLTEKPSASLPELQTSTEPEQTFTQDTTILKSPEPVKENADLNESVQMKYGGSLPDLPKYQNGTSVFPKTTDKYGNTGTRVKLVSDIDQDTGKAYAAYAPEYSLPEVKVTGSKNDITNSAALQRWSKENDPIAYAARKSMGEAADNINLVADMLPGYGDVKDFMYLGKAIKDRDYSTLGIAAGAAALPFVSYGAYKGGKALLREGIYNAVNPVGYGVKGKLQEAPKEFIKNITSNPTERAYRIGAGMMKNMKGPTFDVPLSYKEAKNLKSTILKNLDSGFYKNHKYMDGKKAEDIALRQLADIEQSLLFGKQRLDAWNLGMRGKQDFNTLQKVEEGVYRMNPYTMRPSDADFARLSEIAKNYKFDKNPNSLTYISPFDLSMDSHKKVLNAMDRGYINPLDKNVISRKKYEYIQRYLKDNPYNFTVASPGEHLEDLGSALRFHRHGDQRALRGNYTTDVYPIDQRTGLQKIVDEDVWDIQPFQSKQNLPKFIRDIEILNTFGKGNFKLRNTYEVAPQKNYSLINAYRYGGSFKQ